MYPVIAWGLKAAMCGGIDGVIKIIKDSAHISCRQPHSLYYFPYNENVEATDNIVRLQQHKSLNTTRSAARIIPSRRKK